MINARETFTLLPPEGYPWQPVESAGVVHRDGFAAVSTSGDGLRDRLDDRLRGLGAAPIQDRMPVLAVGSNRAAEVLRTKFGRAGVSRTVPVAPCRVQNLAIGHLAHVSLRGYLPAAPVHRVGVAGEMVIGWLDQDQVAAMDDTEPGYRRCRLHPQDYPIGLAGAAAAVGADLLGPDHAWAYVAQHRLLAERIDDRLEPVLLRAQPELYRLLAAIPGLDHLDWQASAAEIAAMLDAEEVRQRVPRLIAESGLTVAGNVILR